MLTDSTKLFRVNVNNPEGACYGTFHISTKSIEHLLEAIKAKWGKDSQVTSITEINNFFVDTTF